MAIKKTIAFVIVILFIELGYFYFIGKFSVPKYSIKQACFNTSCFVVEVASTTAQREKGLMYRKNLDENKGMLFVFDTPGVYPFWMKNTLIPLDIIWIDKDYKVVFVAENVPPCEAETCPSVNPQTNAKYVLEINGGSTKEFNIKSGDLVQISPGL